MRHSCGAVSKAETVPARSSNRASTADAASVPRTFARIRQTAPALALPPLVRDGKGVSPSGMLDVGVHHLFFTGNVEMDGELIVFDIGDSAVAEFLMEHPAAHGKPADSSDFLAAPRNCAILDQQRPPHTGRRM